MTKNWTKSEKRHYGTLIRPFLDSDGFLHQPVGNEWDEISQAMALEQARHIDDIQWPCRNYTRVSVKSLWIRLGEKSLRALIAGSDQLHVQAADQDDNEEGNSFHLEEHLNHNHVIDQAHNVGGSDAHIEQHRENLGAQAESTPLSELDRELLAAIAPYMDQWATEDLEAPQEASPQQFCDDQLPSGRDAHLNQLFNIEGQFPAGSDVKPNQLSGAADQQAEQITFFDMEREFADFEAVMAASPQEETLDQVAEAPQEPFVQRGFQEQPNVEIEGSATLQLGPANAYLDAVLRGATGGSEEIQMAHMLLDSIVANHATRELFWLQFDDRFGGQ